MTRTAEMTSADISAGKYPAFRLLNEDYEIETRKVRKI